MVNDPPPRDGAVIDDPNVDDYGDWLLSSDPRTYAPNPEEPLPDCDLFRGLLEKYWSPSKPPSASTSKKRMLQALKKERKKRERMVANAFRDFYAKSVPEDGLANDDPPRRNPTDESSQADDADERPGIPTPETIDPRAASSDSAAGPSRNEAPPAAIEASSRRATPQDSGDPPPRVPTPATAEDQSASGLRRAIDNLQNAEDLSPPASPPSTPLNPRRTVNDPRASNISTPLTDRLLQELKDRMDGKTSPQKKRINSFMSKLIRDNQSRPSRPSSRTPAEELPINYQAFENYAAARGGAVVSRAARHANDPSFNLESAAGQARRRGDEEYRR
ncbi:hypothetical protein THAOC_21525 [Thalassiosira oceanica]|uniref:Uncharacterized protein n=1 Tax=Thalassiosira oceanica TaxID=159749 RepID=K0SIM8_THAOC|nr:hypothetical protein THAOC_21525 [Thalassiosira oceanica]|eukprot:EJK58362.1 hypothetical protein THAOC_21525 [Thalassiosira oceanica]